MHKYILTAVLLFSFESVFSQQNDLAFAAHDTIKNIENDSVKRRKTKSLQEISIHAKQHKKTVTAVRSGLKAMDNPQSLQTIGSEVIEQQQAIRLSDVIKNTNGVYVGSARGGAQESFWSRGYDMSTNNMFKNGFRYNSGSIPEVSSLEKVEFLKGGSALLFGNVAPGGILNLVTKTPKFTEGGELNFQTGSYSYYKPTVDFYGPLNNYVAYRFISSYEKSESFRDFVTNDRIYVNPSVAFLLSKNTQLTLQGDYLSADWTPDFGTGIIGKKILDIPRNMYFGALWSRGNTKSSSFSLLLNHEINSNWKLNFNSSFQSYRRTQLSTSQMSNLNTYSTPGNWKRGLTRADSGEKIFGNQISLQGCFKTGELKHQIFTGMDFEFSTTPNYTFGFFNSAKPADLVTTETNEINLFNYDYNTQSRDVPFKSRITQLTTTETQRFGVYIQDLISLTEKLKVFAGIRWSWQEAEVTSKKEIIQKVNNVNTITTTFNDAPSNTEPKNFNKAFSPKAGIVFQPNKEISLFGSYSNSFTPNTGNDINGKALKPSIIDQYESGIKTELYKGKITTSLTVYIIENNNLAQTAPFLADGVTPNVNTNIKELVGGTSAKGLELDITLKPLENFNINAGYSYNDTKITKTSKTNGSLIEGDRLVRTPQNTANLSFFYKINSGKFKGLSIGAIGNYIGDRLGGWNDRYVWKEVTPSTNPKTYTVTIEDREIPLKGYTTVDASLGYDFGKISILCKISNITNELNYTVHENYSVNPIAPRQVMTTLKYKF